MSYRHYTKCAVPGDSYSWNLVGTTFGNILVGTFLLGTPIGVIIGVILGTLGGAICGIGVALLVGLSSTAYKFKFWYYNERLMCIDEKRCIIGTMVGNSHVSTDGDSKFDMLIAPFTVKEVHEYIIEELKADTTLFGTGPGGAGYDVGNIGAVHNYIEEFISEKNRIELYSRVVHQRMFTGDAQRDYLKHMLIRDKDEMGESAFLHSPSDKYLPDPGESVNPMYRSTHTPTGFFDDVTGGSDLSETLLPFLHCELEGNVLARFLENLALTFLLLAGVVAAACFGGPYGLIVVGILLVIIALLWKFNDGDEGDDSSPEDSGIDIGDADREAVVLEGDVLVIYGDWIMDEEHTKYFELHPIRAIHFVLKNNSDYEVIQELYEGFEGYDVSKILADEWATICGMVGRSEEADTVVNKTITNEQALVMMAGFA